MSATFMLDEKALLKRLGGNRQLIIELMDIFTEEAPRNLEALRMGIAQNDAAAVRIACHTLKGSLSYFGMSEAIEVAEKLEKRGRLNQLADVVDLQTQLESLVLRHIEEFDRIRDTFAAGK